MTVQANIPVASDISSAKTRNSPLTNIAAVPVFIFEAAASPMESRAMRQM